MCIKPELAFSVSSLIINTFVPDMKVNRHLVVILGIMALLVPFG